MDERSPRAPDAIEPVIGWRVWSVLETGEGLRLASLVYHTRWEPGIETQARCRRRLAQLPWSRLPLHDPPNFDCRCGIYAVVSLRRALPYLDTVPEHGRRPVHRVVGQVRLWGRLVESDWGWRAGSGYPACLYVPARVPWRSRMLRRPAASIANELAAYGVPVETVAVSVLAGLAA